MGSEWETVRIGDVANVRSGFAFKSKDWTDEGVPVVKIANVKGGRLEMDGCSHVSDATAAEAGEFKLEAGDILLAMTGYIGDVARVDALDLPLVLNQRVGKFSITDEDRLDPNYLFAFLRWDQTRQQIEGLGYGSAQPNVSPKLIHQIELPLPPLPEQRAIAGVLGSLDDKIELNRRMNRTLESMARALFKSWFVDFDPVHANAAGQPTLPPDLAALFPAEFEPSPLGEIPKGWEVRSIGDIGQVICGKTPSTNDPTNFGGNIPFVTIPDMHGKTFAGATRRYLSKSGAATQIKKQLPSGAICVSCIATPGLVVMTTEPSQTNQQINSIIPKIMDHRYFWLSAVQRQGDAIASGGSGGSVFHNLNKSRFEQLRVISPPDTVIEAYCDATSPIFARLRANSAECDTLASLRDALLPKLLGGELQAGQDRAGESSVQHV